MGTSALVLVTGTGTEGPETVRLYRHMDGYPDETLADIAKLLPAVAHESPAAMAKALMDGSDDGRGRPDFRIEGGPWPRAANPEQDDAGDVVEWYYRIDADARRVDVHGRYGGRFYEGQLSDFERAGPLPHDRLVSAGDTDEMRRKVERAVRLLEGAGFGVCDEPPSREREVARAIQTLARAPQGKSLSDLYDSDPAVSSAVSVLIPGFEYPDHSWKAIRDLRREIDSAMAKAIAETGKPPGGLDYAGGEESLLVIPGVPGPTEKREKGMAKAKKAERIEAETEGAEAVQAAPAAETQAAPAVVEGEKTEERAWGIPRALAVPYADKDQAKAAGAVWFGALKTWAVPAGVKMDESLAKWAPKPREEGMPLDDASERAAAANRVFADKTGRKATLALIEACESDKTDERDVTQMLILGADPAGTQYKGATALHRAAECGNAAVCRFLADSGADLEAKDHRGRTPLLKAAYYGRAEVAGLLIEKGADRSAADASGMGFEAAVAAGAAAKRDATPADRAEATLAAFSGSKAAEAAPEAPKARGRAK